eukprot:1381845-Prymnesium_polylepis.1
MYRLSACVRRIEGMGVESRGGWRGRWTRVCSLLVGLLELLAVSHLITSLVVAEGAGDKGGDCAYVPDINSPALPSSQGARLYQEQYSLSL